MLGLPRVNLLHGKGRSVANQQSSSLQQREMLGLSRINLLYGKGKSVANQLKPSLLWAKLVLFFISLSTAVYCAMR